RYHHPMRSVWLGLLSLCLLACGGEGTPVSVADTHPDAADVVVDGGAEVPDPGPAAPVDVTTEPDQPPFAGDVAGPDDTSTAPDASDGSVAVPDIEETAAPPDTAPAPAQPVAAGAAPGRAPMRRLTRHEVDRTTQDLLGVEGVATTTLPPEPETQGFDNQVDAQAANPTLVEALMLMAEQVAAVVDLPEVLPCDPEEVGETDCGHAFIAHFGRRALRRPLSEAQTARFEGLFDGAHETWGFEDAVRLVITAMLQSPHFVYRVELGLPETETDGVVRPSPHEMAARLSYLLWESGPDAELDAAADGGELVTVSSVLEQAERMLGEPGAERMLDHFHRQWLLLDRLLYMAPISPKFASFRTETRLFVLSTLREGEGSLAALLTGTETFADDILELVYGDPPLGPPAFSWVPDSTGFRAASLDPARRAGVLTQPSVLSAHSVGPSGPKSLIRRGAFLLDRLLCSPLPPPPDDVPNLPLDEETELSPPELLALHMSDPSCAGCHGLIDPVGVAFEHYDAIGVWRDEYHEGTPIDAATELSGTPLDGTYDDAVDLAHALAASEVAMGCYVRHWYRFVHGRAAETADLASYEAALTALSEADGDVMTLIRALMQTDAFLYRPWTPPDEEVAP
ncbi:MAG: DUF1588 domain-containing protein, partial [Myxococcota bacterium]|nr:DUF1588 domain-containing protein [Myxococcota bacterium]